MKSPARQMPGAPPPPSAGGSSVASGAGFCLSAAAHASCQQKAQEEGRAVMSQAFSIKHTIFSFFTGDIPLSYVCGLVPLCNKWSYGKRRQALFEPTAFGAGQWDSNPHGLLHRNLNPARLPIPPYPHIQFPSIFTREGMPEAEHPSWSAFIKSVGTCSCRIRLK